MYFSFNERCNHDGKVFLNITDTIGKVSFERVAVITVLLFSLQAVIQLILMAKH
jgi:hypothetical protein